jgi:putative transposase
LTRYIHLNPYSSFVVKDLQDLLNYPWSSLQEYLEKRDTTISNKYIILSNFKSLAGYKSFIIDQADYQRELDKIKHLTLEH